MGSKPFFPYSHAKWWHFHTSAQPSVGRMGVDHVALHLVAGPRGQNRVNAPVAEFFPVYAQTEHQWRNRYATQAV